MLNFTCSNVLHIAGVFLSMCHLQDVGTGTIEGVKRQRDAQLPEAFGFTLSNQAIHEFDREHPSPGREPTPKPIQWAYSILLAFVDKVYEGRAIERFWCAIMPMLACCDAFAMSCNVSAVKQVQHGLAASRFVASCTKLVVLSILVPF